MTSLEPARAMHAPSSEALQQRTTFGTTDLHQPPPDMIGSGPHAQETEEKHPGACWPRAEQERATRPKLVAAEPEEAGDRRGEVRVMRNPPEVSRSDSK